MFVQMMRANKAGVCLIFPLVAPEQHIQWKFALNWIILPETSEDVGDDLKQCWWRVSIPRMFPLPGSHYHDQWQVTSDQCPPAPGATRTPLLNVTTEKL